MNDRIVPVLMYHAVSEAASPAFAPFAVTPSEFAGQMNQLAEGGFTTLTVSGLTACRMGRMRLPARPVALTFDDGFTDFIEEALPVLRHHDFVATLYAVAGRIGATSDWLAKVGEGRRRLIGARRLARLRAEGIEVGAHGVTHAALDALSPGRLREEVAGAKTVLEDVLGRPVDTFAYPFGFEGRRVREAAAEAGYTSACAVRYATSSRHDPIYAIPRHVVRRGLPLEVFGRIAAGTPPSARLAFDRMRSRTYAAVRPILRKCTL